MNCFSRLGKQTKKDTKKKKGKDLYKSKKKKKKGGDDDDDVEDSDEEEEFDRVESKEVDYMSETSSGKRHEFEPILPKYLKDISSNAFSLIVLSLYSQGRM